MEYRLEICALAFLYAVIVVRVLEGSAWAQRLGKGAQVAVALSAGSASLVAVLAYMGNVVWAAAWSGVIVLLLLWVALSWTWDKNDRRKEKDSG